MRLLLAIIIGKAIAGLIRLLKIGGASAAPGLYALKIEPDLVTKLATILPKNVIITGTNGKTTTARILAHFAKTSGLKVIRNHTGSNLERGISSTLINSYSHIVSHSTLRDEPSGHSTVSAQSNRSDSKSRNVDLGIWELDEAAFNTVVSKVKPNVVVFLNVFRDQLDRYGEVDTVVKNWCQTLKNLPKKTVVLVNGDDSNILKLKSCFQGKVETFGVENFKITGESIEHLKEQESLDFEAKNVKLNGLSGSSFVLTINDLKRLKINLPLPGLYHIYDALAALASAYYLGFPIPKLLKSFKNFQPAFGRVEKLPFGYIFLIKNPAGATQVLETITPHIKPNDRLLLALNDNIADGKDVSWIWDADFERLAGQMSHDRRKNVHTVASGTRVNDLAVRLKYAGIDPNRIIVESDLKKALQKAREGLKGRLFILPTYTAMLELQSILVKTGIKKHYWEEEN